jgi:Common central domain of tyrosinase/Polyphenol oxidase middle domain
VARAGLVRRDVWNLRANDPWDPITEAYARAVAVMQGRPGTDPTSWAYQAAIHATFTTPVPAGAPWNSCQHQSWYFLSWHRMYLYYFERILRAAVLAAGGPPDFALPYWNYDRQEAASRLLPPAFREQSLPDGSPNPLFIAAPDRSPAIANGSAGLSTLVVSSGAAMALTNFSGLVGTPSFGGGRRTPAHFGGATGQLESTPHNGVHVQIGGFMGDPREAALDPIFWLHHANVDRLWNRWLALGGGRVNPLETAWLDEVFRFHDETGAAVTLTGAQVVDSAVQLGYVYDA